MNDMGMRGQMCRNPDEIRFADPVSLSNAEFMTMTATKPSSNAGSIVRLSGVHKYFGDNQVLDSIDLDIDRGDFVALIGPSGCGKSTLLKLIANLIAPTQGDIRVGGGAQSDANEKLGYVFQDANLMPWLNIRDNVAIPMKLAGVDKHTRLKRADQMIQMVGLSHAARLYPNALSGGMRMRVSIARALAMEPELLLLDEPFGALDEMTRDDLNEELLRLKQERDWTGVFVTHSVVESVFLSSRVVVLSANPGRIHQVVEVDLPYPRTAKTRALDAFQSKVIEVTKALHSVRGGRHE